MGDDRIACLTAGGPETDASGISIRQPRETFSFHSRKDSHSSSGLENVIVAAVHPVGVGSKTRHRLPRLKQRLTIPHIALAVRKRSGGAAPGGSKHPDKELTASSLGRDKGTLQFKGRGGITQALKLPSAVVEVGAGDVFAEHP
jgi:hypothetical protein